MKLLRASCPCGYRTRKARSGYHYYKWWFPVFHPDDATLVDVLAALPDDLRKHIDQHQFNLYHQTPRDDKAARREASAQMQAFDDEIRTGFINEATDELQRRYGADASCIFDPSLDTSFLCPQCRESTLELKQTSVIAFCRTGCEHTYEWQDSEMSGCPRCGHRPHRFKMEYESEFSDECRTVCWCPCSSSTDCISHHDGYCPKCGDLPDTYDIDGASYCGRHHERLTNYDCPANFLFIETDSRWVAHRFPNAKLWGDADAGSDSLATSYCVSCESDHQHWLATQQDDG